MKFLLKFVLCFALLCSECFGQSTPTKIGVQLPLSGDIAEYGVAIQNGILLATREKSEVFSKIKFIFEDIKYDGKIAISSFHKLRKSDGVKLIYCWGSGPSEALAPIAEQYKFPVIIMGEVESARGKDYVINYANPPWQFSGIVLKELRRTGARKIGLVKTEIAYFDSLQKGLERNLQGEETLEIVASLSPGDNDLRSIVSKVKSLKFDSIGVYLLPGQVRAYYKNAQAQGLSVPTFGSDVFESTQEIIQSGAGIEGAIFAENAIDPNFNSRYATAFGTNDHIVSAGRGYDFANLIATTLNSFEDIPSSEAIWKKLKEINSFDGVVGDLQYVETDEAGPHFAYPVKLKIVRNRKVEIVG